MTGNQAVRACHACRQRKTLCDRLLPDCSKCTRAGRACPGYDRAAPRTVFVNLGVDNVRTHKKRLLSRAIAETKAGELESSSESSASECPLKAECDAAGLTIEDAQRFVRSVALRRPDFRAGQFRDTLSQLWFGYQTTYCTTAETWPPGYASLGLRSEAMDLGLVALCALRLSLNCADRKGMRMLSLAAYGESLRLFARQVAEGSTWDLSKGTSHPGVQLELLAATSTIFAFWEASQTPLATIIDAGWGASGHLQGAAELARRCGPATWCRDGYHPIFRKLREMSVSHAIAGRWPSFFGERRWLSEPWIERAKTWRDMLWDLGAEIPGLLALDKFPVKAESKVGHGDVRMDALDEMASRLHSWHANYITLSNQISKPLTTEASMVAGFSSLHIVEYPSVLFTYCEVDYLCFQTILGMRAYDLRCEGVDCDISEALANCRLAVRTIQSALRLPAFDQDRVEGQIGMTEGRCRALLPSWVVKEYLSRGLDFDVTLMGGASLMTRTAGKLTALG